MDRYQQRVSTTVLLLLLAPLGISCAQDSPQQSGDDDAWYTYQAPSRNGIGKYYMGREIAHVMSHVGASWLERPERERSERTDLVLENLPLQAGDSAADLGAGSGYFTLPMARIVGEAGTVYAVDIQPQMLAIVERRSAQSGLENIEPVLATTLSPGLPANSIDLALMVDAYHEFESPREVMLALRESLVPGGKVVLIEYRAEDPTVPIIPSHKMTEKQVKAEMEAVGLEFVSNSDILPQQHYLIFRKPLETAAASL